MLREGATAPCAIRGVFNCAAKEPGLCTPLLTMKCFRDLAGCSLNIVFFSPKTFNILRPLPRQHLAAIGCTQNGQPIRVTVDHYDLSWEWVALLPAVDGLKWIGGKTQFLRNTLNIQNKYVCELSRLFDLGHQDKARRLSEMPRLNFEEGI